MVSIKLETYIYIFFGYIFNFYHNVVDVDVLLVEVLELELVVDVELVEVLVVDELELVELVVDVLVEVNGT